MPKLVVIAVKAVNLQAEISKSDSFTLNMYRRIVRPNDAIAISNIRLIIKLVIREKKSKFGCYRCSCLRRTNSYKPLLKGFVGFECIPKILKRCCHFFRKNFARRLWKNLCRTHESVEIPFRAGGEAFRMRFSRCINNLLVELSRVKPLG